MKLIRSISPFVSFCLAMLMLAGSTGLTIVKHRCNFCGQVEVMTSISLASRDNSCCCHHEGKTNVRIHDFTGSELDNDCCSHEVESLITREVAKTEIQKEVIPYFMCASVIALIPPTGNTASSQILRPDTETPVRDLTKFLCRIIS